MLLSTALWSKDVIFAFSIFSRSHDLVSTVLSTPAVKYLVFEPEKQDMYMFLIQIYSSKTSPLYVIQSGFVEEFIFYCWLFFYVYTVLLPTQPQFYMWTHGKRSMIGNKLFNPKMVSFVLDIHYSFLSENHFLAFSLKTFYWYEKGTEQGIHNFYILLRC